MRLKGDVTCIFSGAGDGYTALILMGFLSIFRHLVVPADYARIYYVIHIVKTRLIGNNNIKEHI